uniref:Ribonuclease T2 n=1 Tax=Clandestinovirus TaxID=2831644 RepID=A0A8F8PKA4_9VIRU|nr:ribonuclease T2 [Clandestinovirus]
MRQIALLLLLVIAVKCSSPKNCFPSTYTLGLLYDHKVDRYQMHGLWVDSCCKNSSKLVADYPFFCKNVTWEWEKLKPIWSNLTEMWYPHGDQGQQKNLMEHEWLKHGSCTPYDILSFFKMSLCIREQFSPSVSEFCPNHKKDCSFPLEGKAKHIIDRCNLYFGC